MIGVDDMNDTVPVSFVVEGVEPARDRGRLVGLAIVAVEVGGAWLQLQGVQVIRDAAGALTCRAPVFRHPRDGRWLPAVLLPPELTDAIAAEVLAAFDAATRPT
jgi:stage V sporulation protein G